MAKIFDASLQPTTVYLTGKKTKTAHYGGYKYRAIGESRGKNLSASDKFVRLLKVIALTANGLLFLTIPLWSKSYSRKIQFASRELKQGHKINIHFEAIKPSPRNIPAPKPSGLAGQRGNQNIYPSPYNSVLDQQRAQASQLQSSLDQQKADLALYHQTRPWRTDRIDINGTKQFFDPLMDIYNFSSACMITVAKLATECSVLILNKANRLEKSKNPDHKSPKLDPARQLNLDAKINDRIREFAKLAQSYQYQRYTFTPTGPKSTENNIEEPVRLMGEKYHETCKSIAKHIEEFEQSYQTLPTIFNEKTPPVSTVVADILRYMTRPEVVEVQSSPEIIRSGIAQHEIANKISSWRIDIDGTKQFWTSFDDSLFTVGCADFKFVFLSLHAKLKYRDAIREGNKIRNMPETSMETDLATEKSINDLVNGMGKAMEDAIQKFEKHLTSFSYTQSDLMKSGNFPRGEIVSQRIEAMEKTYQSIKEHYEGACSSVAKEYLSIMKKLPSFKLEVFNGKGDQSSRVVKTIMGYINAELAKEGVNSGNSLPKLETQQIQNPSELSELLKKLRPHRIDINGTPQVYIEEDFPAVNKLCQKAVSAFLILESNREPKVDPSHLEECMIKILKNFESQIKCFKYSESELMHSGNYPKHNEVEKQLRSIQDAIKAMEESYTFTCKLIAQSYQRLVKSNPQLNLDIFNETSAKSSQLISDIMKYMTT